MNYQAIRTFSISILLAFFTHNVVLASEFLVAVESRASRPKLGDGFDVFAIGGTSPLRNTALSFATKHQSYSLLSDIVVKEVKLSNTSSANRTLTINGSYPKKVKAKFSQSGVQNVFTENKVFSVDIKYLTSMDTIESIELKPELSAIGINKFRDEFGTHAFYAIENGGYISLAFRFHSNNTTSTNKILASLNLWKNKGNISLDDALSQNNVSSTWSMVSFQVGGTIVPLLASDPNGLSSYLEKWTPSVFQLPEAMIAHTKEYGKLVDDFPYPFSPFSGGVLP